MTATHSVRLCSEQGELVTLVQILPYHTPPTVIMWEERTFVRSFVMSMMGVEEYREVFAVRVMDPATAPPA